MTVIRLPAGPVNPQMFTVHKSGGTSSQEVCKRPQAAALRFDFVPFAPAGEDRPPRRGSASQIAHLQEHLFVGNMRVRDRSQRARVPGEPLGEEQVSRCPVHVRDGRVRQDMEPGDEAAEASADFSLRVRRRLR